MVMSRMTSDIENLQQLLQDGLAQFAMQGLTMVVITVILFFTNVRLATITVVAVLPPLVVMSIWFKRASERGYTRCATASRWSWPTSPRACRACAS